MERVFCAFTERDRQATPFHFRAELKCVFSIAVISELILQPLSAFLGISDSTLHRLELGDQNITIDTLEEILKRLKCSVTDIFSA
jgi:DNA-binding Xre family transcriptional regulator